MEDDGKYSCTVGNSGGLDQDDAYLHVARKDTCLASAHSMLRFLWCLWFVRVIL